MNDCTEQKPSMAQLSCIPNRVWKPRADLLGAAATALQRLVTAPSSVGTVTHGVYC